MTTSFLQRSVFFICSGHETAHAFERREKINKTHEVHRKNKHIFFFLFASQMAFIDVWCKITIMHTFEDNYPQTTGSDLKIDETSSWTGRHVYCIRKGCLFSLPFFLLLFSCSLRWKTVLLILSHTTTQHLAEHNKLASYHQLSHRLPWFCIAGRK